MTEETRRALRTALLEDSKKTHEQRWQEMIDHGFINAKGNVLLREIAPIDRSLPIDPEIEPADELPETVATSPFNPAP